LPKVIAELGESVSAGVKAAGGEDGLMDVGGSPSVELRATVQQHFHQPDHPGVVDPDTGDFGLAGHHRQGDLLK
jgi:hypothetical protein